MTVNPGFGGQSFIENVVYKISELDRIRYQKNYKFLIEVDGGLNSDNARVVVELGADILVFGSFIFSGNRKQKIESIRKSISRSEAVLT